jgi:3-isopropylmalate/(R)-2-methylmalate dehydratase small subunit
MALEKILSITGTAVPVPGDDLDTDRIIPARFMKCVTFDGLGEFMFYDVRFDEHGQKKAHPLNDERFHGAQILITGNNFGCGSSREHAPQAIYRYGIRAIIAEGFAEIFFGNSTTLGIPCITVSHADRLELTQLVEADPTIKITVDVEKQEVRTANKTYQGQIRESARQGLITGHWDPIADLLDGLPEVEATAANLPYLQTS